MSTSPIYRPVLVTEMDALPVMLQQLGEAGKGLYFQLSELERNVTSERGNLMIRGPHAAARHILGIKALQKEIENGTQ